MALACCSWFVRRPLALLLPCQAVLLFWRLDLLPVWGDEQFTLDVAATPWGEIGAKLAADIHPPLYYFLVKLWIEWGAGVEPIVAARGLSAGWMLAATVVMDRLWLAGRDDRTRVWFLALWVFSPLLLLYGRMARSYSMQMLLAVLCIAFALRLIERPALHSAACFSVCFAALLYTHYLPGVAVGGAVAIYSALRRAKDSDRRQVGYTLGAIAGAVILYSPWLPLLLRSVERAAVKPVYSLSDSVVVETLLRLGYTFISFHFGEALPLVVFVLAALLSLPLAAAAVKALRQAQTIPATLLVLLAAISYVGAASWVSYAFTPARLMYLFPLYLLALVAASPRAVVLSFWLVLMAAGDASYFFGHSLLNPAYALPFEEIAREVRGRSPPETTLLILDAGNTDPSPLRAALGDEYALIFVRGGDAIDDVKGSLRANSPSDVWVIRSARDITPGAINEEIERFLGVSYRPQRFEYLPYSLVQRIALEAVVGVAAPNSHYQATLFTLTRDPS